MAQQETTDPTAPEYSLPTADPVLMRQQELKQQLQQINQKTGELRQQRQFADDMIRECELQTAGLMGALREIEYQQKQKG